MTLVAAGWYCMKDDILLEKNTLRPTETPEVEEISLEYYKKEELIGKEVFSSRARKVGSAKDIAYSKDGRSALVVEKQGTERIIPFDFIDQIGDIIILKSNWRETLELGQGGTCPACGVTNPGYATRFCVSCGAKLD